MNDVLQQLKDRRSVRVFLDRPIPAEVKAAILQGAVEAPTAGNQQLYTILDVTDPVLRERLSHTCDEQPFIATAPMVLIFCADCRKWYEAYRAVGCDPRLPGVGDLMLAVSDATIAAQNAVVAAHSLGVGSCYIGDIMERAQEHRELLQLPRYVFPAAMLVLGYPTPQQQQRQKPPRAAMEHIVHQNTYRKMPPEELRRMLEPKAGVRPYEEWLRTFCDRKYQSDFSREMTRSVGEYLKDYTD